ncbi:hypothetical protein [Pseudonocardia sp. ICBG1142]|uniref:hypothetical protein n=1 Tax=Pseudonocardia sp. ICBG1142 TaxID=2846760 RepID=UPI001CF6F0A1|nr:hypothetical protein [Pseudonocardia sp. ICBG1142]
MGALNPRRRKRTAREVAARAGVSERTVRAIAAEPRAEYLARAKARRARVTALRDQGLAYKQIAEATGETLGMVGKLLSDARCRGEWEVPTRPSVAPAATRVLREAF